MYYSYVRQSSLKKITGRISDFGSGVDEEVALSIEGNFQNASSEKSTLTSADQRFFGDGVNSL